MLLCILLYLFSLCSPSDPEDKSARALIHLTNLVTGSCPPVNNLGDKRACLLRLSQLTLPGSHNSGAGAGLRLSDTWFNLPVPSCKHQNQRLSVTQQLELGVRALDLDTAYQAAEGRGRVRDGVLIAHCAGVCATGAPLLSVLAEVASFLLSNPQELLVIRFKDHHVASDTDKVLLTQGILEILRDTIKYKRVNYHTDPLLSAALILKRRVFVQLHTELWRKIGQVKHSLRKYRKYLRPLKQLETWTELHHNTNLLTCDLREDSVKFLNNSYSRDIMTNYPWIPIVSDWYEPGVEMGACLTDAAEKCRDTLQDNILLAEHLQHHYNRTINVLYTDYTDISTVNITNEINRRNIAHFVDQGQGFMEVRAAHSHHTSQYPFEDEEERRRRRRRRRRRQSNVVDDD